MEEFVKVVFPTRRKVRVDGEVTAFTNKVFQLETGHHTFDLGKKANYTPDRIEQNVQGTRASEPLVLTFKLVDGD